MKPCICLTEVIVRESLTIRELCVPLPGLNVCDLFEELERVRTGGMIKKGNCAFAPFVLVSGVWLMGIARAIKRTACFKFGQIADRVFDRNKTETRFRVGMRIPPDIQDIVIPGGKLKVADSKVLS